MHTSTGGNVRSVIVYNPTSHLVGAFTSSHMVSPQKRPANSNGWFETGFGFLARFWV